MMGWTRSSYERDQMRPVVWSTSLVSSQWVSQRWTHTEGTTNYELQTHGMWHSQWQTVSRSAGQEFPTSYGDLMFKSVSKQRGNGPHHQPHKSLSQPTAVLTLHNFNIPPAHTYIFRLTLFRKNFGWKLCMNFSYFSQALQPLPVITYLHLPSAH